MKFKKVGVNEKRATKVEGCLRSPIFFFTWQVAGIDSDIFLMQKLKRTGSGLRRRYSPLIRVADEDQIRILFFCNVNGFSFAGFRKSEAAIRVNG